MHMIACIATYSQIITTYHLLQTLRRYIYIYFTIFKYKLTYKRLRNPQIVFIKFLMTNFVTVKMLVVHFFYIFRSIFKYVRVVYKPEFRTIIIDWHEYQPLEMSIH